VGLVAVRHLRFGSFVMSSRVRCGYAGLVLVALLMCGLGGGGVVGG